MSKSTPGPWRWDVNPKHRIVQLVGGRPQYDLTVMDFERWGMNGAAPRFREDVDGLNLMHRADEHAVVVPGREHHAEWFRALDHPDARLIAAAPDLLAALARAQMMVCRNHCDGGAHHFNCLDAREAIRKATEP